MMNEIYEGLAARTGGKINIAVAGPAGAGKSAFVRRFSETAFPQRASLSEENGCDSASCAGENGFSLTLREYKAGDFSDCDCIFLIAADGSFGAAASEEDVMRRIAASGKPFVALVNSAAPEGEACAARRAALAEKCGAAFAADCEKGDVSFAAQELLFSFPVCSMELYLPDWIRVLPENSRIVSDILNRVRETSPAVRCMRDCSRMESAFSEGDILCTGIESDAATGKVRCTLEAGEGLFYRVLSEECGAEITDDLRLMAYVSELGDSKKFADRYRNAFKAAEEVGYGIAGPAECDLVLGEPELFRRGTRCGVKLKADAPTYHIIRVDVHSEVSPVTGDGARGEEIAKGVMDSYEKDAEGLWNTDMFGRTFKDMVRSGLDDKVMPDEACGKLRRALTRIVNEGKGGVICILL